MSSAPRIAIVASTGGSVADVLLARAAFVRHVVGLVSDRDCGALDVARRHGVPAVRLREASGAAFSDRLLDWLGAHEVGWVVSFYTKLFRGPILDAYRDRIVNLHPSLLPSFKGLDAFGDACRAGVRFVGTTIHLVDERMDEGKIVLQTTAPLDPGRDPASVRHVLFEHQCRGLLQVVRWIADDRLVVEGGAVRIRGARYDDATFAPALDDPDARALDVGPCPRTGAAA
jgi:phosphoribosylglycinamide formyltransferase-1